MRHFADVVVSSISIARSTCRVVSAANGPQGPEILPPVGAGIELIDHLIIDRISDGRRRLANPPPPGSTSTA